MTTLVLLDHATGNQLPLKRDVRYRIGLAPHNRDRGFGSEADQYVRLPLDPSGGTEIKDLGIRLSLNLSGVNDLAGSLMVTRRGEVRFEREPDQKACTLERLPKQDWVDLTKKTDAGSIKLRLPYHPIVLDFKKAMITDGTTGHTQHLEMEKEQIVGKSRDAHIVLPLTQRGFARSAVPHMSRFHGVFDYSEVDVVEELDDSDMFVDQSKRMGIRKVFEYGDSSAEGTYIEHDFGFTRMGGGRMEQTEKVIPAGHILELGANYRIQVLDLDRIRLVDGQIEVWTGADPKGQAPAAPRAGVRAASSPSAGADGAEKPERKLEIFGPLRRKR